MLARMSYDALIVGGGPAGLFTARRLAEAGFSVVVCEEHETIGEPVHCTGVLSAARSTNSICRATPILNPLTTVRFVSPAGLQVRYSPPHAPGRGHRSRGIRSRSRREGDGGRRRHPR